MSKGWDNAMLKKLKALTGKGLSTAEIGKKLGMSKNAVVGKLNRLGWNSKAGGAPAEVADKPAKSAKTAKTSKTVKTTAPAKGTTTRAKVAKVAPAKPAKSAKTAPTSKAKKSAPTKPVKTATVKAPAKSAPTSKAKKEPEKKATSSKANANKNLAMHQRIVQHSLEMASLKPNQCRWPIGDPDSENFHFCGETVFVGKPYCYEHCKQAYQFTPPKKK